MSARLAEAQYRYHDILSQMGGGVLAGKWCLITGASKGVVRIFCKTAFPVPCAV